MFSWLTTLFGRVVTHPKTTLVGLGEGAVYNGLAQVASQDPQVQKFALILSAIRLIIGALSRDPVNEQGR